MGHYETMDWVPQRQYRAYVPHRLEGFGIQLPKTTAELAGGAYESLIDYNAAFKRPYDNYISDVTESVSSSLIEGIYPTSIPAVLKASTADEAGHTMQKRGPTREILGNYRAHIAARTELSGDISARTICDLHSTLMALTSEPQIGGVIRDYQNWIGGHDISPLKAAYVPPPHKYCKDMLDDLCRWVNLLDDPALCVPAAAIAHLQYEMIHPFGDGNGRSGRALMHAILARFHLNTPPVSSVLCNRVNSYYNSLETAQTYIGPKNSKEHLESMVPMIELLCEAVMQSAYTARLHLNKAAESMPYMDDVPKDILDCLAARPVTTPQLLSDHTGIDLTDCTRHMNMMAEAGTAKVQFMSHCAMHVMSAPFDAAVTHIKELLNVPPM